MELSFRCAFVVLVSLTVLCCACKRPVPEPLPETAPAAEPLLEFVPLPYAAICLAIEGSDYTEFPRELGGNRFDPSGVALAGRWIWMVNDKECRDQVPDEGCGIYRLDPETGEIAHIPLPGLGDKSRKHEAMAWDGTELFAIGNIGGRKANTFLVSFTFDPASGELTGTPRFHDLASAMGAATGFGDKPWDHGIKVESLSATGPGQLILGLRTVGDSGAARAYRATVSPPDAAAPTLQLEPLREFDALDLGTARNEDAARERELSGLSDQFGEPPVILGVASAEFEQDPGDLFLANGLVAWWPDHGEGQLMCAFDEGRKIEGVAFAALDGDGNDRVITGTLVLLYDNDALAPGGYRVVEGIGIPGSPIETKGVLTPDD